MSELKNQVEKDVQVDETESASHSGSSAERHSHHHSHHHHHHSRHHSRHHSHRKSSPNRKTADRRKSFRRFVRKNRKKLIFISVALLFCICSVVAGTFMDNIVHWGEETPIEGGTMITEGHVRLSVPVFDQPVSIQNSAADAVLSLDKDTSVNDIYKKYKGSETRLDIGQPVVLSYNIHGAPQGYIVDQAVFLVSENENLAAATRFVPKDGENSVECVNLKVSTAYFYRLDIRFTNGVKTSVLGNFTTADGVRMMTVDGAYNMRDVGGWKTTDGKRIKQGLLYRGCELDGAIESKYTLTETGKGTMLTQLNIKTDLDLRTQTDANNNENVLGDNVQHMYYNMQMYTVQLQEAHAEKMRALFADLADPSIYPAYLHCTYGQDRTGTVCYILGAMLGMSQEDLMADYNLSGLHHSMVANDDMDLFTRRLQEFPGSTLSEKVERYLLDIGVTPAQIQSIRSIFLEEVE